MSDGCFDALMTLTLTTSSNPPFTVDFIKLSKDRRLVSAGVFETLRMDSSGHWLLTTHDNRKLSTLQNIVEYLVVEIGR